MKTQNQLSPTDLEYIRLSLLHLGAAKWTKSAIRLKMAIEYALSHDTLLDVTVGDMYEAIAEQEGCDYRAMERSLRYAISNLWMCDPRFCSKLFFDSSEVLLCPSVSDFLYQYKAAFEQGRIKEFVDSCQEQKTLSENNERKEIQELLDNMAKIEV